MKVKLEDVCYNQSSNLILKDIENMSGEYPVYGAAGYIKGIDSYKQEKAYIAIVKDGAGVGRTMILPSKSSIIGTLQYILPKDNIDIGYLNYALIKLNLSKYASGATIPHIYFKDYKRETFELPNINDQRLIVKKLDRVSHIISLRQHQLEKLDLLVKSRFVEMFGDLAKGEYRFSTKKLGEVAKVGSSHRVFTTEFVEKGIPFYRGTEIGLLANGLFPEEPYYISEEHYNRLSSDDSKPLIGDLLLPSICDKGQVWMVDTEKPFYYKDGRVLCVSADRSLLNTKYLQYYMRMKTEIEYPKLGSGSTFAEFKIFLLKDIDVVMPPRVLQDNYADFVQQVDKSKFAIKNGYK